MSSENESVSPPLSIEKCSLVLVDVAGTTTSINFVKDTLFHYVTQQIETFLKGKWDEEPVKECIQLIKDEGTDLDLTSAIEKIKTLTKEESSNKGLKTLQGLIYKEGYEKGDLKAHIFDDVSECFESWAKNRRVAIYSTGGVDSQKLLFSHTIHGDVSAHIHKYFDQTVGPKTEADSYKTISKDVEVASEEIVFITDDLKEATAAKSGGMTAVLIKREGNAEFPEGVEKEFMVISSFKDLGLDKVGKRKIEEEAAAEETPPAKIPKTDVTEVAEPQPTTTDEKTEDKGESMEVDSPTETVEEKKTEETEKPGEMKSTLEETEKSSEKESEKTESETKEDGDTEMKEEKVETTIEEPTKEENAQKEAEDAQTNNKTEIVEEKKETKEVVEETPATTEEKPKEVDDKVVVTEETKEKVTEETKTAETRVEETKPEDATTEKMEETTTEETKVTEETPKEETKLPKETATPKTDAVEETPKEETKVAEETAKAPVDEPQTSQDKPEEKKESKVEVSNVASEEAKVEELAKPEDTKPATPVTEKEEEAKATEEKPTENGEEKQDTEEAETSNKVEEKENKSVLANGVENGKDESEVDNTPGESTEVKIDDDKNDETDVRVKKLEESAESKTVSVEV